MLVIVSAEIQSELHPTDMLATNFVVLDMVVLKPEQTATPGIEKMI